MPSHATTAHPHPRPLTPCRDLSPQPSQPRQIFVARPPFSSCSCFFSAVLSLVLCGALGISTVLRFGPALLLHLHACHRDELKQRYHIIPDTCSCRDIPQTAASTSARPTPPSSGNRSSLCPSTCKTAPEPTPSPAASASSYSSIPPRCVITPARDIVRIPGLTNHDPSPLDSPRRHQGHSLATTERQTSSADGLAAASQRFGRLKLVRAQKRSRTGSIAYSCDGGRLKGRAGSR